MQLTLFVVLAVFLTFSEAIVCPANICSSMRCEAVENCEGKIKSGFCGCCSTCVKQLGESESCFSNIFMGVPATSECGEGLECNFISRKCTKKNVKRDTDCNAVRIESEQKLANGNLKADEVVPVCDADGSYSRVQCSSSKCYCASTDGANIGYDTDVSEKNQMNCECARDQNNYGKTGLIGKMFYCASNGNYNKYRCVGSVCFCTDVTGNQVGQGVNIGLLDTLNC